MRQKLQLVALALGFLFVSACSSPGIKHREVSGLSSTEKLVQPVHVTVAIADPKNEDLRPALEKYLRESFEEAGLKVGEGPSELRVELVKIHRVSFLKRQIIGKFAGTPKFRVKLTFPGGEVVTLDGSVGSHLIEAFNMFKTTDAALKMLAQTAATEAKKRV